MTHDQELITAQTLAESLDLSVDTIWRYTREKKIPCIELGHRQYRYRLSEVIKALSGACVQEDRSIYKSDTPKAYTYQDYLELPEEPGYRFEILEGQLFKEPSPNVTHQRTSRRLQRILEDYFWQADPEGEVFNAPLDVTFGDVNVVQPDLLYVSGRQKSITKLTHINGPPTLIVEILSPSTGRKDRLSKMQIYQQAKVQHYWLVNPDEKTLECFSLHNGMYTFVASGMEEDAIEHPEFSGLVIDLQKLW